MIIPPFNKQIFVDKDGNLSASIQQVFDILFQQMQSTLSDDGMVMPALTTSEINNIADPTNINNRPNGTIWYDSETQKFKGKENGIVKTFTLV